MELEFYLLDVSYEIVMNEPHIIMWAITRDGQRIVIRDRHFRPYFYVILRKNSDPTLVMQRIKMLSENPSPISKLELVEKRYMGNPVKSLKATTIIPEYVRKYREKIRNIDEVLDIVEADIRFSMRYILDHGLKPCGWHIAKTRELKVSPGYRVSAEYELIGEISAIEEYSPPKDLRILAMDIEVYGEGGSPRPEKDPVIIIGLMSNDGEIKQFVANNIDDRPIIKEFVNYVIKKDPDIIVGYNNNNFDWPYLLERSRIHGIKLDIGRKRDSMPSTSTYGHISIPGRLNVDLLNFAEEIPEIKLKSLDIVADYLGVMKRNERVLIDYLEIPRYWNDPEKRELLLRYNLDDVKSTMGLAEKFLPFAMQLSNITGLPLDQVGAASVGYRLEWFLMREAYRNNELIPNRIERSIESYKGAVVLKPLPGIHENIAVMDFTSMYPNIMIKYNVGPDTIVYNEPCNENLHNIAPELGHCFKKEPAGFFKNVLQSLLKLRKSIRDEMKKYHPDSYEYKILDERQRAVKILANATYGYMGWAGARWYCRECAEAVTAWGRQTINKAIEIARALGLRVIYGDTDSIFVTHDPGKIEEFARIVENDLGFEIKIDKIYKRVFFSEAKKRYAGLLEDGRIDIVGFEAVRGDWAEIAKEVQEKVTEILLRYGDLEKAIDYVRNVISDLNQYKVPLEKLIIWKTLTKPIEEYEADAPHVAVAKKMIRKGIKIAIGDKVGYVVLKGYGKISERVEPYMFIKDIRLIDVNYYIDHQIVPAVMRILEYFGVTELQLKKTTHIGKKSLFDYLGKTASSG
ncbi:MAG: DNA polymerase II [Desulfurococcaceae archaeon]